MPENVPAPSPLESLRERWDREVLTRTEGVLHRHGRRLSPAERDAYAARLRSAPATARALRRRLLDRLLRAAAFRRRPRPPELPEVPETGARGPYNDRAVLEDAMRRLLASDAGWTREFLDLYGRMEKLRVACRSILP